MKVLHTADWHLGHFSRFEEQQRVMNEICDIADSQNVL
jgi:exonuclease SbcD